MFRAGLFAKAVLLLSIASIAMICSTKMAAQMKERTLTCTPLNSDRMKCVTTFEPAVSGGGDWFGPYWDAVSMTPDGYKIESASLMWEVQRLRIGVLLISTRRSPRVIPTQQD